MKKLLFALALLTVLAVASSAVAETVYINMAGATAQVGFWKDAADDFLRTDASCATAPAPVEKEDNMIAVGTDCDGLGLSAGDNVVIRYSGFSSYTGFLGLCGEQTGYCTDPYSYPVLKETVTSTTEARVTDNCYDDDGNFLGEDLAGGQTGAADCDLTCAPINAAVSDVEANAFVQFSDGYDIKKKDDIPHVLPDFSAVCPELTGSDAYFSRPLIVPFAFYVNNYVERAECVVDIPAGAHVAYDPNGAACSYDEAIGDGVDEICRGYYKCVGGFCQDGVGTTACSSTSQCPFEQTTTNCVLKPLDNMSRFMAEQIFSGGADNWRDFGPAFPNKKLKACVRHAGSGTHATLDLQVMRGDLTLKQTQLTSDFNLTAWDGGFYENPALDLYAYIMSTSSSSLIACVADIPYAVGYADTDKLFGKKGNAHMVKYQGVYPTAESIKNGTYNFWAAQVMGYLGSRMGGSTSKAAKLFDGLVAFVEADNVIDPTKTNLEYYLPAKADFWVLQKQMNVEKSSDFAYPTFK